ncbi:putative membrane protein [Alloactinosynnema sp. L-07]|uniref:antibiotic biosynthesis monooxygenase n=1 Tax=Alloactinosynnema sp. L-07 TaxID=1653480 RepID=UPI00065EFBB7|nr:antibiotic biosynthesis monooxygenase [Alloactinosynnema sp. L-07]CRK57568.1 putative membrane protein [Alloactinosynnema sp. L-07]
MVKSGEVTALVARSVEPGCERQFEQWVQGILEEAAKFPGHLGHGLLRPAEPGQPWHVMYRFRDESTYEAWQASGERAAWFAKADGHHEETARRELTGLEAWFESADAPPKWKMAISSGLGIFPLTLLVNLVIAPSLGGVPIVLRTVLITALFSVMMTYVIMPNVARVLRGWLHPSRG